ncbi:MAG: hypothetical protein JWM36_3251 [Hyphomicrobiales bacterium]|nr:hypothetical protein [Hyphomicrobiales bacterium]
MARNWYWSPGSYRGASFYVNTATPSGGRRLSVQEYPGSETHDVEDLGRCAPRFSVTCYFVGESADSDHRALVAALDQEGAGSLTLPMFGTKQVRPEKWDPSWTDAKLNAVAMTVSFVLEGTAGAPTALGLGERILSGLLADLPGVLGAALGGSLSGFLQGTLGDALLGALGVNASNLLPGSVLALLSGGAGGLFSSVPANSFAFKDAADALVEMGSTVESIRTAVPTPDNVSRTAQIVVSEVVYNLNGTSLPNPGDVAALILVQLDNLIEAIPAGAGADVLADATSYAVQVANGASDRVRVSDEGAAVFGATAIMLAAETIRILATSPYDARPDAIAARRRIGEVASQVLPLYGALGPDVVRAFNDVWGQAVDHLAKTITTLAPIVLIEVNRSLPSTFLAYRLYGDPARAPEIVARNQTGTPFLMPTIFEAMSK